MTPPAFRVCVFVCWQLQVSSLSCYYDFVSEIIACTLYFGEGELVKVSPEVVRGFILGCAMGFLCCFLTWLGGNRSKSCSVGFISPDSLFGNQTASITEIPGFVAGELYVKPDQALQNMQHLKMPFLQYVTSWHVLWSYFLSDQISSETLRRLSAPVPCSSRMQPSRLEPGMTSVVALGSSPKGGSSLITACGLCKK